MFVNYPVDAALDNNFVHESISEAITLIFDNLNRGIIIPDWPLILPERHRKKLSSRRKLRDLLVELKNIAAQQPEARRNAVLAFINTQNSIDELLSGTIVPPAVTDDERPFIDCLQRVFIEGFSLLTKTKSRDTHYKAIYDSLTNKTCPFCGYEPFEAPGLKREDEDHYLLKDIYVTSAANLLNLVPMGGKCNKSYKLQQDIIVKNNTGRKALNPYGNVKADICLSRTPVITLLDEKPDWTISISPDIEETRTWYEVFSIEERLKETVLSSNYQQVLGEIGGYLASLELNRNSTNAEILVGLRKYEVLKRDYPEQGLGFLKDKVAKMINHYFEVENPLVLALIKDSLPEPEVQAA
ncbi:hypothetical protein BCT19_09125 [Vibrio splendidus]|uniref:hypothetical protein n=1 Tax=Vibrio splendidus TaxID=29497 RepID=UPI000C85D31C|nr:hypothetical protein [Vibrio splendidus]PMO06229.1 hypothetical protein BCT19_09125 [Vibrio splendidus]